jgi:hypothetical protein
MYNSQFDGLPMRVTTADFIKNYGSLSDRALTEPLRITKHGKDRFVMLSAAEYDRLKRRDRRVVAVEDMTDDEIERIASAEIPVECLALDAELGDWKP